MSSKKINLDSAKKDELRSLCKAEGVKGYGKLSNDRMRAALRALIETDPNYGTTLSKVAPVVTTPVPVVLNAVTTAERERNGVRRPKEGGLCAAVWEWLDAHPGATLKDAKAEGARRDWNENNVQCELYAHRKWRGLSKSQPGKHGPRRKSAAKLAAPATLVDASQSAA